MRKKEEAQRALERAAREEKKKQLQVQQSQTQKYESDADKHEEEIVEPNSIKSTQASSLPKQIVF
jgi:phage regulator Rha-like protein